MAVRRTALPIDRRWFDQTAREEGRPGSVVAQGEEEGAVGVEDDRVARARRLRHGYGADDRGRSGDRARLVDGEVGGVLDKGDLQRRGSRDAGEVRGFAEGSGHSQ